jgi:hypothetical protein
VPRGADANDASAKYGDFHGDSVVQWRVAEQQNELNSEIIRFTNN